MKEKIRKLREAAKLAREKAKALKEFNMEAWTGIRMANTTADLLCDSLNALADGHDLMAGVLESLYNEQDE